MEPAARVIPICFYRLMFLCGSGPPPPSKSEAQTAKQLHDAVTKNDSLTRELQAAQQALEARTKELEGIRQELLKSQQEQVEALKLECTLHAFRSRVCLCQAH